MKTDYRTERDKVRGRKQRDRRTIELTIAAIVLVIGATAVETLAQRGRYAQTGDITINNLSVTNITDVTNLSVTNVTDVTNLSVTNVTDVTQIVIRDGGNMGGGNGKGRLRYDDDVIDVISVRTAYLRLQLQEDDFAIVNNTLLGRLDFYGDDDSANADEVAGQIDVTSTGTWTDGAEDGRMELSVANNGVLNDDQLVLNTDGTISVGNPLVSGLRQTYLLNMADPPSLQASDTQWSLDPNTAAALTITKVEITLDADPTTELDMDLKYADAFIGLANATLIGAIDTTSGTSNIISFTDATVPANKCVYVEFGGAPDAATLQANILVIWDYD